MRCLMALPALLLASCGANQAHPAVETRIVTQTVEVQVPCPAVAPVRPAKLTLPLPTDAVKLAATLAAKLAEYSAPGGFADRALAAIDTCKRTAQ